MSFRGGRGGFRGGGAGRGPGGGAPMGDVSFKEVIDDKAENQLYPEGKDQLQPLVRTTRRDLRHASLQLKELRRQRFSPYWPSLTDTKPTSKSSSNSKGSPSKSLAAKEAAARTISMKDLKLHKAVFPQRIWNEFLEGENKRVARAERRSKKTKVNIDWTKFDNVGADRGADGAGDGLDLPDADEEEEEQGEYEDEMDDDYNQNYFDPGEDDRDDLGDEGGGGDEGYYE